MKKLHYDIQGNLQPSEIIYYSIEYPESHKRHFMSHLNHLYWQDVYGHTRKDINGRQYTKGFVELKIDKSWKT